MRDDGKKKLSVQSASLRRRPNGNTEAKCERTANRPTVEKAENSKRARPDRVEEGKPQCRTEEQTPGGNAWEATAKSRKSAGVA